MSEGIIIGKDASSRWHWLMPSMWVRYKKKGRGENEKEKGMRRKFC
jgi:hypothetical protein